MKGNLKQLIDRDGYVVIENFLTDAEADELRNEAVDLIEKNLPQQSKRAVFCTKDSENKQVYIADENKQNKDKYFLESANNISYFFEVGALDEKGNLLVDPKLSLNKLGHALHEVNPVFRKVSFSEKVKECAFQLGFQEPAIAQSMYIFKNPGIGGEVLVHQDSWYLFTEPNSVIGFWIALEDTTLENGCLWFSKGSHKSGVHRRYIRNPDKDSDDLLVYSAPAPSYQKSSFTPLPVSKGSLVLIHGNAVHYSESNKTKRSRNIYTFHVIEQKDTKYSQENWLQPSPDKRFLSLYKN